ncbi:hypothetical protein [Streptomyces sp. NPDC001502]|uniref:hypothetical protein n=1 Tax=Streptomyces sp. NPDC001502 TaxID=3364578 RepID=UPI0036AE0208
MKGRAGERPGSGAGIVVGDRFAAVAADSESLARQGEAAGLGLDAALADLAVAVVGAEDAGGDAGRDLAVLLEGRGEDELLAGREFLGGGDQLVVGAEEVVDVVQAVVADEQGVSAEAAAVREQHAAGIGTGDVDEGADGVGAVADADRDGFGDLGATGPVGVAAAGRGEPGAGGGEDLQRGAVVQGQGTVDARFVEPQADEFGEALRFLRGEVVEFGAVLARPRGRPG